MAATLDTKYTCGECGGPYMRGHYLHELMFRHKPDCEKRRQMDALAVLDIENMHRRQFYRNIRPVELYLFERLGADPMPVDDATVMLHMVGGQSSRQYLRSNLERLARSGIVQENAITPRQVPFDTEGF